jgi:hypothetical protein
VVIGATAKADDNDRISRQGCRSRNNRGTKSRGARIVVTLLTIYSASCVGQISPRDRAVIPLIITLQVLAVVKNSYGTITIVACMGQKLTALIICQLVSTRQCRVYMGDADFQWERSIFRSLPHWVGYSLKYTSMGLPTENPFDQSKKDLNN